MHQQAQLDERPDTILFNPADDKGLVAPLTRITDAAIPVVGFVNRMSGRWPKRPASGCPAALPAIT
jgi:ABC-type sugar transport system substrate-binding protein